MIILKYSSKVSKEVKWMVMFNVPLQHNVPCRIKKIEQLGHDNPEVFLQSFKRGKMDGNV